MTPRNAHDAVFAFTFGRPKHAVMLLRAALPLDVMEVLDWRSLRREPASFVNAKLKWRHSDLLFSIRDRSAPRGKARCVYLLVEHQSKQDRWMALRLVRYVVRTWEEHLRSHKGSPGLPEVFPIVVYSGKTPWRAPRTLGDLLFRHRASNRTTVGSTERAKPSGDASGLLHLAPLFIELCALDPEGPVVRALTSYGRLIVWAMTQAGNDRGVLSGLRRFKGTLRELADRGDAREDLEVFWRYLFATHAKLNRGALQRFVVKELGPDIGGHTMTLFDRLVEKGRKEGRTEGRAEMLLEILSAKFGSLSGATKRRVREATSAQLLRWSHRVLTSEKLSQVLGPARSVRAPGEREHKST